MEGLGGNIQIITGSKPACLHSGLLSCIDVVLELKKSDASLSVAQLGDPRICRIVGLYVMLVSQKNHSCSSFLSEYFGAFSGIT